MIKPFCALLAALLAVPALAYNPADEAFNKAITDINEAMSRFTSAQKKAGETRQAEVKKEKEKAPAVKPVSTATNANSAQVDQAYTDLKRCDDSLKKSFGGGVLDASGAPSKGFNYGGGMSLVALTTTDAYFYHEDCDICAAVEKCSLKDGKITNFKTAHSVDCRDLAPALQKDVVYSACK